MSVLLSVLSSLFFTGPATLEIYTLSLHDALPISGRVCRGVGRARVDGLPSRGDASDRGATRAGDAHPPRPHDPRSEEHTSELQSLRHLVCRLLLEKKKKKKKKITARAEQKAHERA